MRNTLHLLSIFIIVISFTSCKSWFDKNIQSDSVNIISPFNNFTDSILLISKQKKEYYKGLSPSMALKSYKTSNLLNLNIGYFVFTHHY